MTEPEPSQDPGRRRPSRFDPVPAWAGVSTRLIHGARRPDYNAGAVVPPIYQTATFHFPSEFSESTDRGGLYLYTRLVNPTVEVAAELLRQLEGGEAARLFGSGMGAFTSALLSLVKTGDEVVALDVLYGGTLTVLSDLLPRFGVKLRFVSEREAREPESILTPNTRLAVLESPTNPLLTVHDITRWGKAADAVGAILLVDNTFASPINQNPLALGADLVYHSATKFLGGHSDLIAGAIVGPANLMTRIDTAGDYGASLDPFAAFLLARSLRTLPLRIARQNENGRRVAEALATHPLVERVYYPGRASEEEEAIASRQMRGRGSMVTVSLRGGAEVAQRFLRRLRFVHVAASLGGVDSLASVPALTSHRHLAPEERARRGIADGLVRFSFGIEDPDDLVRDLTEALDQVR
ncbi:MAG TPA: aminotransferase class I/II-fold pyridoxal phosphate-dependent enzyme [Thermoplasmata archaeon]|jgi:cystathionine beta-lyase/cystathionine gamma-synthase|nr:aminotransferase class I/II-fold pyridoxal phosphate-dependent enzyme [Thermoplasmata archaeon]